MSNDITDEPAPVSSLPRLRFSLLAALLFITLICLALGYAYRTRHCHATAMFRVNSQKWSVWDGDTGRFDAQQFEILKNTQVALIKSYLVLQSTLRDPTVASLPIFAGKDDPVAWLQENLEVGFPGNTEILEIRLRDREIFANDLKSVVDAVATAYAKEIVVGNRDRAMARRDAIVHTYGRLEEELIRKTDEPQSLKAEMDKNENADIRIRQQDIATLNEIAQELRRRITIEDVNRDASSSDGHIQKLQPAMVTFE